MDRIFGLDVIWSNYRHFRAHDLLADFATRFERCGNTYLTIFGSRRVISTIEPDNLKSMLSTNSSSWNFGPTRTDTLMPLMGNSIFTLSGEEWQHSRNMIRSSLVKDRFVNAEMSAFEKHIERLLSSIPRDGSVVDLQQLFFKFTLSTAIELLTGQDVQMSPLVDGDIAQTFEDAEWYVGHNILLSALPFHRFFWGAYIRCCKLCHRWVDKYVHRALEDEKVRNRNGSVELNDRSPEAKSSLLHELVKETDDAQRIRSELIAVFIAARDTTACALSSLWFVLARRPDVVGKLHREIADLGSQRPDFAQLKKLRYLQNVIQEVLRLYPPLPYNMRTATEDTILPTGGGPEMKSPVFVSKGQLVTYNIYAMHRRKDIYGQDAESFRPERWEDNSLRPGWGYLPFNGGPRICLGQQFALTEIAYTTVRLLQEFQTVQPRDDSPWQENWLINCSIKTGCQVSLMP